jgi:HSP20 family protein
MIARNPFELMRELATMQDRLNRAWSGVYDRESEAVTNRGTWMPLVDIYQTGNTEIVMKAELAGVRREDIHLAVENNTLTISGERRHDEGVPNDAYHRVERAYGSFSRTFTLPNTIDAAAVKAEYRDGVLTVRLPLRAEARARQIEVAVAE